LPSGYEGLYEIFEVSSSFEEYLRLKKMIIDRDSMIEFREFRSIQNMVQNINGEIMKDAK